MKKMSLILIIALIITTFNFNCSAIEKNEGANSRQTWEIKYNNNGKYNGELKEWDMNKQYQYELPKWSTYSLPYFNTKVVGNLDELVARGDAILLTQRIINESLGRRGFDIMGASKYRPDVDDLDNLVGQAQILVSILIEKDILKGYKTDSGYVLDFDKPIKKGELAKILAKYLDTFFNVLTIPNAMQMKDISEHWAAEEIKKVIDKGIMSGDNNGMFNPEQYVTILEMSQIATNFIGKQKIITKDVTKVVNKILPIVSNGSYPDDNAYPDSYNQNPEYDVITDKNGPIVGEQNYTIGPGKSELIRLRTVPKLSCLEYDFRIVSETKERPVILDRAWADGQGLVSIVKGISLGNSKLYMIALDGSKKIFEINIQVTMLDYTRHEYNLDYESRPVIFPYFAELETDISKYPPNYELFPYIQKNIPLEAYEGIMGGKGGKDFRFPVDVYKERRFAYDIIPTMVIDYYDTIFNIDYETIDGSKFLNKISGVVNFKPRNGSVDEYVEYVKANKIKMKGSIEVYMPTTWYSGNAYLTKCKIKLQIISSDTNINLLYGDADYSKYSKIVYDKNEYESIILSTVIIILDYKSLRNAMDSYKLKDFVEGIRVENK